MFPPWSIKPTILLFATSGTTGNHGQHQNHCFGGHDGRANTGTLMYRRSDDHIGRHCRRGASLLLHFFETTKKHHHDQGEHHDHDGVEKKI